MTTRAHLFVIVVMVALVVSVVLLVRRHRLKSKYSMLWLALSVVLLAAAAFPGTLDRLSDAIGIDYPPATFLFLAVAFLLTVVVHFSWELSRLEERSRRLAEEAALLRADHERLAAAVAELGGATAGPTAGQVRDAGSGPASSAPSAPGVSDPAAPR